MSISFQTNIPNALEKFFESRLFRKIGTKNQSIDEESNQSLNLSTIAIRDRRSDNHILLPRITVEQYLKSCHQRHELSNPFASTQFIDCFGQRLWQR